MREITKNIPKLTFPAKTMKTGITVSHTAGTIMAICSFLVGIPAAGGFVPLLSVQASDR
jgi:hypothetical protein